MFEHAFSAFPEAPAMTYAEATAAAAHAQEAAAAAVVEDDEDEDDWRKYL